MQLPWPGRRSAGGGERSVCRGQPEGEELCWPGRGHNCASLDSSGIYLKVHISLSLNTVIPGAGGREE